VLLVCRALPASRHAPGYLVRDCRPQKRGAFFPLVPHGVNSGDRALCQVRYRQHDADVFLNAAQTVMAVTIKL
jgi:hypothetical protein